MRIALVSTPFVSVPPANYGGTELVVHELAEGLVARGHDVVVFATGDSTSHAELRACFPNAVWPPEHFTDLDHTTWAMHQIARDGAFDIVHAHTAPALACARFLEGVPLVYTLHHERVRDLSRYYAWHPEVHFVAISEDQRRREIPLPHVDVIHHGVQARLYEWQSRADDYVCFVGRLAPVKGVDVAIDVAGAAGLEIRVAGSVHEEDEPWAARVLAPRLRRSHVLELGRVGMAQKVPLLRDARALLAPIDWEEPFGLVLVEAMLAGCPVVAFPRGSVPELVEPGVTGFVAHSAEEMADIIAPGGPLEDFDRWRCRQRAVDRFSSDRMVDDYEALYERILFRRPASEDRPDQRRLHVA